MKRVLMIRILIRILTIRISIETYLDDITYLALRIHVMTSNARR
jgi:hypothetical protein